jgi:hypothetical protein
MARVIDGQAYPSLFLTTQASIKLRQSVMDKWIGLLIYVVY